MTEFERINAARPGKIVEMLRVIDASARSQKASPDDVRALLQPVYEKLGATAPAAAPVAPAAAPVAPAEAPAAPQRPGVVAVYDGLLIVSLNRLLENHEPEAIRAALDWVIRQRGFK